MTSRPAAGLCAALLVACAGSTQPAPAVPPSEIVITTDAGGGHHVVSVRTGATIKDLPAGALAIALTGGGDVGEAYDVAPATNGHAQVLRIAPDKGFATALVADVAAAGSPQAALLPAPQLTHFVGPKTVLAVRFGDGRLSGYQAGTEIWTLPQPRIDGNPVTVLAGFGGAAAVGDGVASWGLLVPETGEIKPVGGCEAGPLAAIGSAVVFSCRGELDTVPSLGPRAHIDQLVGVPWTLPTPAGGVVMVWPGGDYLELDRHAGVAHRGRVPAPNARPLLTPDGKALVVVTDAGLLRLELATRRSVQFVAETGIDSIGLSRDGNFVYALRAGVLEVFASASGARAAAHPAIGSEIELVAGG